MQGLGSQPEFLPPEYHTTEETKLGTIINRGLDISKKLLAPALAALAFGAYAAAPQAQAESTGSQPVPHQLVNPHDLPGANYWASINDANKLKEATYKVVSRDDQFLDDQIHGQWSGDQCSAVLFRQRRQLYASLAAHCLEEITGVDDALSPSAYPNVQSSAINLAHYQKPFNLFNPYDSLSFKGDYVRFALVQVSSNSKWGKTVTRAKIMATASDVSASLHNSDWAILKLLPDSSSPPYIDINKLPAIEGQGNNWPIPLGSTVDAYGFPARQDKANKEHGEGMYLGRINVEGQSKDLVGVTKNQGMCKPGSSGSSFVGANKAGKPYFSGPLASHFMRKSDADWYDYFEHLTGLDLSSFPELCAYTASQKEVLGDLISAFGTTPSSYSHQLIKPQKPNMKSVLATLANAP